MSDNNEIVLYQPDALTKIDVCVADETVWLTQQQLAMLFGTEVPAISKHIRNIYKSEELNKSATLSKMEIVQQEGTRQVKRVQAFYNLDAIISVSELLFNPIDFGGVCFYVISFFCPLVFQSREATLLSLLANF